MTLPTRKVSIPADDFDKDSYKGKALLLGAGGSGTGIYHHHRGEGRWVCSTALLLKEYGYSVDLFTETTSHTFDAGYEEKHENMRFITEISSSEKYDIFFDFCFTFKEKPVLWAKFAPLIKRPVFGTFWPTAGDYLLSLPDNSRVVTPYYSPEPRTKTLPIIHAASFHPPRFSNKTIVWAAKGPFNTYSSIENYQVNLWHLEVTLEAVKTGYKAIFMCWDNGGPSFSYSNPAGFPKTKAMMDKVLVIVEELKTYKDRVEFHDYLPTDEFTDIVSKGSVMVTCNLGGATPDCILQGLAPIMFHSWNSNFVPSEFLVKYGAGSSYEQTLRTTVRGMIFRLLEDESFFNSYLNELRSVAAVYTTDEALRLLHSIVMS